MNAGGTAPRGPNALNARVFLGAERRAGRMRFSIRRNALPNEQVRLLREHRFESANIAAQIGSRVEPPSIARSYAERRGNEHRNNVALEHTQHLPGVRLPCVGLRQPRDIRRARNAFAQQQQTNELERRGCALTYRCLRNAVPAELACVPDIPSTNLLVRQPPA